MSSWDTGYGDFVMDPDFDTLRWTPWQPGTALVHRRSAVGGRFATSRRPRVRSCASSSTRLADLGLTAYVGNRARVHRLPRQLRTGVGQGLPRPDPGQPVQRRLLAARHGAGRAAAAADPTRDGVVGPLRRVGQGRVQPRTARDRLPVRRGAGRLPTTTSIYKEGAKEIAAQEGMALTFMAKFNEREGNSCHIHISVRGNGDGTPMARPSWPTRRPR